ncbi:MAG: flagellar assembly protein FliH [Deltaproteobacteria bacterium]|nr:flagellar assembly protein FliH [Deltaproteobacteria bacterium]
MAKVIKRSSDNGDISPDTGFTDTLLRRAPIIRSDVIEARSEGQLIRERAEAEATEIREQAQQDAHELKEQARNEGYKEGCDKGAAELSQIVAESSRRLQQIEEQAIAQLRDLALTIARKIIGCELELRPEVVVDIIKQALSDKARQRRELVLRVNPDDLAVVREHRAELLEVLSRAKEIAIREDPNVARYGVVIETDAGIIDAQLETQLAVFERVLLEAH